MRRFIIYFIWAISSVGSLFGANYICTDEFDLKDGLPNNGVTALLQDSKGYMWVATYDGLVRYNGNSFTLFANTIDSKIFQSNRIRSLLEDRNSNIWIGTDFGITIYDYNTGQFRNLESGANMAQNRECIIREIMSSEDGEQIYCLTEQNGVLIYNVDGHLIKNFTVDRDALFQDALHFKGEKYLLASNKGVVVYDFGTAHATTIHSTNGAANFVGTLARLSDDKIVYGTNKGIKAIKYNHNTDKFDVSDDYTYPKDGVKRLYVDKQGNLWIGALSQGVFLLEDAARNWGKPLMHLTSPMRISEFFSPHEGSIWIATYDNGLFRYSVDYEHFKSLDLSTLDVHPIRTVQMLPYDDDYLIYQNSYKNISYYDLDSGEQRALPFALESSEMQNLQYIAKMKSGDVWLFMSDGDSSWRLINPKKSSSLIRVDDEIMSDFQYEFPYTIVEDYSGHLWIGNQGGLYCLTFNGGRDILDVESVEVSISARGEKIDKVNTIYPDSLSSAIWVGTSSKGLFRVKYDNTHAIAKPSIVNYRNNQADSNSLPSNFISQVTSHNDTMWIATEQGGLCRVEMSGDNLRFVPYGTDSGLSSNSIKSILSDKNGDMWISTNFGISYYNTAQDKFMIYRSAQGVPFDEFADKSIVMGDKMVFAAPNNICYFTPSQLPQSSDAPHVEFSRLEIYGQTVVPTKEFNKRVVLDHSLRDGDKIELKHDENMITIGVDALHEDSSHKTHLQYRLHPLSDKWISLAADAQEITLSGLQHGNYTLEVMTTDFFRRKSNIKRLQIEIAPPFWLSMWAYIIYALLIVAVGAAILYAVTYMQRLRYRLHIEEINKHNAETMNTEKLRYFSNISHEIKTPLTLIVAPISLLLERFTVDVDVRKKLETIKRQSEKIIRLVDLVQGIQLSDSNLLKRNDSRFSFNDFIADTISDFRLMALYDSKEFVVETPSTDITIEADSEMLEKIVNNLISNAFKYTRMGEQIKLSYCVKEQHSLVITVEDSGYGIGKVDLDHIFERFFRAQQRGNANVGGTGIGLYFSKTLVELHNGTIVAESEVGAGTKFTVSLPVVRDVKELATEVEVIEENYKEQILGELTIEKISSDSEFKDSLVYIVEDNSEMRQFISSIISKFFCVKTFSNGAECYEAMSMQWPDIVVSDVMMPVMDGYELCETIKSDIKTSHIPIVLLTACSTVDDKIKGLKYGADAYIPKPFYPNHIITRIETLLKGRKHLRERFQINIPIVYGETSTTRAKDNEFLDKLYQIFSDNLDNDELDIDQVVHSFGINRNLLYQKVKAITNATPRELLQIYRLKRAAEYLQAGDKNVSEVCDLTGFKSRTHFSRLFKDMYGVSPSQYGKK